MIPRPLRKGPSFGWWAANLLTAATCAAFALSVLLLAFLTAGA